MVVYTSLCIQTVVTLLFAIILTHWAFEHDDYTLDPIMTALKKKVNKCRITTD